MKSSRLRRMPFSLLHVHSDLHSQCCCFITYSIEGFRGGVTERGLFLGLVDYLAFCSYVVLSGWVERLSGVGRLVPHQAFLHVHLIASVCFRSSCSIGDVVRSVLNRLVWFIARNAICRGSTVWVAVHLKKKRILFGLSGPRVINLVWCLWSKLNIWRSKESVIENVVCVSWDLYCCVVVYVG